MKLLAELVVCAFIGAAMAFILLGWFYQCGESYVDAKGDTHVYECPL